jgi:hypothetical protein
MDQRCTYRTEGVVAADMATVFPLLCPIREMEWIPGWKAQVVCSSSGVAEPGAVFHTRLALGETWVVTRHEPPTHVEYAIFTKHIVETLVISLSERPGGVAIAAVQTFTALDLVGRLALAMGIAGRFGRMLDRNLEHLGEHLREAQRPA